MSKGSPEFDIKGLTQTTAESATINVMHFTNQLWLALKGEGSDALEHAILTNPSIFKPVAGEVFSAGIENILQRSIDAYNAGRQHDDAFILHTKLEQFQKGDPFYFFLHTRPKSGFHKGRGILFRLQKPQTSPEA